MNKEHTISAFISHASSDKSFVRQLASDLEKHGIKTWVDEAQIGPGDDFISKIEEGIMKASHIIIVLSRQSSISSWVREETHAAQIYSIRSEAKIVPLLLGELNTEEIPLLLRSRLYVDFREPHRYEDEFCRLLSAFAVSALKEEVAEAKVLLPRIEDAHILQRTRISKYAIEVLLINPSSKPFMIKQAVIGGFILGFIA
jgi:TIR domain